MGLGSLFSVSVKKGPQAYPQGRIFAEFNGNLRGYRLLDMEDLNRNLETMKMLLNSYPSIALGNFIFHEREDKEVGKAIVCRQQPLSETINLKRDMDRKTRRELIGIFGSIERFYEVWENAKKGIREWVKAESKSGSEIEARITPRHELWIGPGYTTFPAVLIYDKADAHETRVEMPAKFAGMKRALFTIKHANEDGSPAFSADVSGDGKKIRISGINEGSVRVVEDAVGAFSRNFGGCVFDSRTRVRTLGPLGPSP